MSKPQTYECPNCGASLDSPGSGDLTVRCPYCDSSVIVPEELHQKQAAWDLSAFDLSSREIAKLKELRRLIRAQQKVQAIKVYRDMFGVTLREAKDAIDRLSEGKPVQIANMTITGAEGLESAILALTSDALEEADFVDRPSEQTARLWGLSGLSIALLSVGCSIVTTLVIGAIVLLTTGITISQVLSAIAPQGTTGPAAMPVATPTPVSFALPVLTFGSEGTGPGLFTDARHVAVDGEGNIYVGEYSDGRVQVFDSSGQFISLWMIDAETPLRGLSADRRGTVYVVQGGEIFRHEGESGRLLGQVEYAEGWGFDDVTVTADGGLVAAWYKNRDDIVRFDAQGNLVQTIPAAISGQSGDSELDTRVAVDGLGNIYALGTFNRAVFKFGPDGRFITRFGSHGDEPGQFGAPNGIAVDGQGRVYVSDFKGIQVFDADGRYLHLIEVDGPAFGMAFNDQGELFVAARHKVIKYVLQ